MTDDPPDSLSPFGPFLADVSPLERAYLTGWLAGNSYALCGSSSAVQDALHRARSGRLDDLAVALAELERLPAVQKRRVLGSYMARMSPGPRPIVNGKAKAKETVA
jgi:hypothetical protein